MVITILVSVMTSSATTLVITRHGAAVDRPPERVIVNSAVFKNTFIEVIPVELLQLIPRVPREMVVPVFVSVVVTSPGPAAIPLLVEDVEPPAQDSPEPVVKPEPVSFVWSVLNALPEGATRQERIAAESVIKIVVRRVEGSLRGGMIRVIPAIDTVEKAVTAIRSELAAVVGKSWEPFIAQLTGPVYDLPELSAQWWRIAAQLELARVGPPAPDR